jgi:hypothetical protein
MPCRVWLMCVCVCVVSWRQVAAQQALATRAALHLPPAHGAAAYANGAATSAPPPSQHQQHPHQQPHYQQQAAAGSSAAGGGGHVAQLGAGLAEVTHVELAGLGESRGYGSRACL